MTTRIFIDGGVGTTGIEIGDRLAGRPELTVLTLAEKDRKDAAKGKANYVTLLGLDAAKERVSLLAEQTRSHLEIFGERAEHLRESVDFVLDRRN